MDGIKDNLKDVINIQNEKISFTVVLAMSLIVTKVIHLIQIISALNTLVSVAYFISICLDAFILLYAIIKDKRLLQITIIGSAINLLVWTSIWLGFVVYHSVVFIIRAQHMVGNIILVILYISVGAFILVLIVVIIKKSLEL